MEEKEIKKFKKHIRKAPCFTCLIRPTCVVFFSDGASLIKEACGIFRTWERRRNEILPLEDPDHNLIVDTSRNLVLEILKEEKERSNE
jgi:hypothetical protein